VAYFSLINFLFMGCNVLLTPYGLARLGSPAELSVLLVALNVGAVAGSLFMGAWGGTRPRMHAILIAMVAEGVFVAMCGVSRGLWPLASFLFLLAAMPPIANAAFLSIFQVKIAPDAQGRVFASIGQVAMLMQPLGALVAGPLADRVLEPARHGDGWRWVAPFVGAEAGSGIGLLYVIVGGLTVLASLAVYALPRIRRLEATMPDYAPAVATERRSAATREAVR